MAMGVGHVVDMRAVPNPDARVSMVKELTGGWGGGRGVRVRRSGGSDHGGLRMVGLGGRYLEIGAFYPGSPITVDPGLLVMANVRLEAVAAYDAQSQARALGFLERHVDDLPSDQVVVDYPLEAIDEAFADAGAGKVTRASLVTA